MEEDTNMEEEFPMIDWENEPEGIWLSEWMDAMGISPEPEV